MKNKSTITRKISRELFKERKKHFSVSTEEIVSSYMLEKDVFLRISYNACSAISLPLTKSEALQVINALKKEFGL